MKPLIILSFLLLSTACGEQKKEPAAQQQTIQNTVRAYSPGLGEFMLGIQIHHAKLWFAGTAQNWPLAEFETGEITEALEAIKQYNTDRPEIKSLPMIEPAMDSITAAIKNKDLKAFKAGFTLLTNTCNNCHTATHHEFNVIKIPEVPPYSNQEFKVK